MSTSPTRTPPTRTQPTRTPPTRTQPTRAEAPRPQVHAKSQPQPQPRLSDPDLRTRRWRRWAPGPVALVLILASLALMLLDLRGGPTDALRSAGAVVGGPLQSLTDSVLGPVRTGEFRRADTQALQQQVADLEEANRRLQAQSDILAEQLADAPEQRAAASAAQRRVESAVAARVVAADPGLGSAAVTIDVGSADGVVVDSPVLVAGGLVGRVVTTAPTTATVLLVTDPGSSVAVRVGADSALAQGTGDRHSVTLGYLDPLVPVEVGQKVVTQGSDDDWPYPAGLPVGTVRAISGDLGDLDRVVTVEPAAGMSSLDQVIVLTRPTDSARPESTP